jgi:hypothetical protein
MVLKLTFVEFGVCKFLGLRPGQETGSLIWVLKAWSPGKSFTFHMTSDAIRVRQDFGCGLEPTFVKFRVCMFLELGQETGSLTWIYRASNLCKSFIFLPLHMQFGFDGILEHHVEYITLLQLEHHACGNRKQQGG